MNQPPLPALFPLAGPLVPYPPRSAPARAVPAAGLAYTLDGAVVANKETAPQAGATLPVSPYAGQLFLWQPTGRSWLMEWDGSNWQAVIAYGAATLYVDTTNGTDSIGKGTGTGVNAYKTLGYALARPPLAGNPSASLTINMATGTYAEAPTIAGFAYPLTIVGAFATDTVGSTTATSGSNPGGNGTAGFGTITKSGAAFGALTNLYIQITSGTGNGQLFPIYTNTATVITVAGPWVTAPDSTSVFHVFDMGTNISGGITVTNNTALVTLQNLKFSGSSANGVLIENFSNCNLTAVTVNASAAQNIVYTQYAFGNVTYCVSTDGGTANPNVLLSNYALVSTLRNCLITGTTSGSTGIFAVNGSIIGNVWQSYINIASPNAVQILLNGDSSANTDDYLAINGSASSGDNVQIKGGSTLQVGAGDAGAASAAAQTISNSGAGWGIRCSAGGTAVGVQAWTYSGNFSGTFTPITQLAGGTS